MKELLLTKCNSAGLTVLLDDDVYELLKNKNIHLDSTGYLTVWLGGKKSTRLHRLIMKDAPKRSRVRYKDGIE
jgi:hypothetical protein